MSIPTLKKPIPMNVHPKRVVYHPKDISRLLSISMPNVYELFNQDDFPSIRVGRKHLIAVEAFNSWLMRDMVKMQDKAM